MTSLLGRDGLEVMHSLLACNASIYDNMMHVWVGNYGGNAWQCMKLDFGRRCSVAGHFWIMLILCSWIHSMKRDAKLSPPFLPLVPLRCETIVRFMIYRHPDDISIRCAVEAVCCGLYTGVVGS